MIAPYWCFCGSLWCAHHYYKYPTI